MKKIITAFSLFFVVTVFANNIFADSGLRIMVEDNNTGLTITGSSGRAVTLSIPETIDGKRVTVIGDRAFINKGLREVTIPDTVTVIGEGAFSFNRLETVVIGNNVTNIGRSAFTSNRLVNVTLGTAIVTIGKGAFSNNMIEEIALPAAVTTIDDYAFFSNRLRNINIPASVTLIGEGAFSGNRLTSIEVGSGVTVIRDGAFYNNFITSVTIPPSLQNLGNRAFDARSSDGRIRSNTVFVDMAGNILYTTASNFDSFYASNGRRAGRYVLSEGNWRIE
jgi:hypothetical protein